MNIIFMGTPDFAVPTLETIYKNGHEISLVVTQKDKPKGRGKKLSYTPVKEKALELGLNVYQPDNINANDSIEIIKKLSPDAIVVVAYGQILKEDILNAPKFGCINVHASLLPKYRGAAPINWAVINGEAKTGITTMMMSRGLDTGDMLLISETDIGENETASELHDRLMYIGAELLIDTINGIQTGNIVKTPQDHSKSTYAPMMTKELGKIDWSMDGCKVKDLVRGTQTWPGAYITYKDKKIKIIKVEICDKFMHDKNGTVVKVNSEGIFVNAKDSCVILKTIQFPGKKSMDIGEYLRGNDFEEGIVLD